MFTTDKEINEAFAKEVLGWYPREIIGEHDEKWIMWHDATGKMVSVPAFTFSYDSVVKYLAPLAWYRIHLTEKDVSIELRRSSDQPICKHYSENNNLAQAVCCALILEKRLQNDGRAKE